MVGIGTFVAATAIQASRANDVLARSIDILRNASTVTGSFTQRFAKGTGHGDFRLKKDKMVAVTSDFMDDFSDGKQRATVYHQDNSYRVQDMRVFDLVYIPGFEAFMFHNEKSLLMKFTDEAAKNNGDPEPREVHMMRLEGKQVVSYIVGGSQVYLDPESALPIGADFKGEDGRAVKMRFTGIQLNTEIDNKEFHFHPTARVKELPATEKGMLAVGDRVPSGFNSRPMNELGKIMEGKKTTIVLFFDDRNVADSEVLSKFTDIAKQGLPEGVGIVGVARTKGWERLFNGRPKFPVITDSELNSEKIAGEFGISKYPTIYILDEGKTVKFAQIGSGNADLDPVLRYIGIAQP